MRVAVLSDTHGLLRPEVLTAIAGADHILHAGDVGDPRILETLATIAPLTAIRGNIDTHGPCADLPPTQTLELDGVLVHMLHAIDDLDLKPEAAGIGVVISGHSHQPGMRERNGVLYLNPGSCGPRRFSLPVSLAWLNLRAGRAAPEWIELGL